MVRDLLRNPQLLLPLRQLIMQWLSYNNGESRDILVALWDNEVLHKRVLFKRPLCLLATPEGGQIELSKVWVYRDVDGFYYYAANKTLIPQTAIGHVALQHLPLNVLRTIMVERDGVYSLKPLTDASAEGLVDCLQVTIDYYTRTPPNTDELPVLPVLRLLQSGSGIKLFKKLLSQDNSASFREIAATDWQMTCPTMSDKPWTFFQVCCLMIRKPFYLLYHNAKLNLFDAVLASFETPYADEGGQQTLIFALFTGNGDGIILLDRMQQQSLHAFAALLQRHLADTVTKQGQTISLLHYLCTGANHRLLLQRAIEQIGGNFFPTNGRLLMHPLRAMEGPNGPMASSPR